MNFSTFNSTLRPASAETIYLQLQSRAKLVLTVQCTHYCKTTKTSKINMYMN